ncbi:hypothetical protein V496_08929 [Pseudogymnoascus sp. VKM F-4515 (FW-2607)]|nr:hypothetical protein V496_08929 [Pseudogymnoascus sp. VKM F-4515 (FW-2607)]
MRDPPLEKLHPNIQQSTSSKMLSQVKTRSIPDQDYQNLVNKFNANEDISLLEGRLDQLFERVVDEFPDNIALIHNETEISYKELNASANIIARSLAKRSLKPGDVVGLAVSRSIDLVAVMLAVLKLGAAYVPIDPSFPAQRINHMIEDADPKFILLSDEPTEGLARWKELCLNVSEARDSSTTDTFNLETHIHHKDVAYIIYTSGSTGRPKGVEVSHGAAANFLSSLRKYEPGCDERDRLLAITTISFDMSVLELFLPILSGSTMIIANAGAVKDPRQIVSLMQAHQVTILQATPATWTMLLESGWKGKPRLSKIICGGEPLSRQLADRLLASADSVWNVHGPAETTYGSVGRVGEGDIVVGKPVANGRIYVLDDDLLPVPIGCEGEVYIGGGSVSNGYRNKAELTRTCFLSNPFHGGIFFRTGDLGRFIDWDKLQVIGRIDGVVKVRGHRIDVGDVEAALVDHPDVSAAVVISRDDRLVAYCVSRVPSSHHATSLDSILRPWVAERLPSYMLPAFFVPMDALPLSPNEKVNRKALPDPLAVIKNNHLSIQPTSELEQQVQAIWTEILGHDRFGIEDNFFNIGGDSVRIIRMQAALERQLRRPVPTPKLFEHFTISTLAAYLAGSCSRGPRKQKSRMVYRGSNEDIAIISMACRLPGGVATPEDFWQVLQSGGDTTTDVPKDRWDADKLYNADPGVDGTSYCRRGGFLDSINSYDASLFGISPREARVMDAEQHLMLELCWESFERAGYTRDQLSGSATGIFLGVSRNRATSNGLPIDLKGHSITGSADATLSGRLSYTFNLHGPSLTVDTACSSSLVATQLACSALREAQCDTALVGGVSLLLTPGIHIEFSRLRGISADGRCRAFSNDTDGTGFSEGAATVILKRLSDARRDGDDIHAVLRGTAVMHGGHSVSLTAPNGPGQESLIRTALAQSALEPGNIDYIEAHGTATKLGDPIEATALAGVFGVERPRSDPLMLGSVKSNIGHTQAAAGLVGLLKVVLSMQNNMLPKTLHVKEPTRAIDWNSANLELVINNRPWLPNKNRIRRAGVSAFGIGGTIAHVIVEEFHGGSAMEKAGNTVQPALPAAVLFVLSGNSNSALRAQAGKLRLHLESGIGRSHRLTDVAYSLATSRTHFQRRLAVAARDKQQMLKQLESISSGNSEILNPNKTVKASLGILFTGQGSQQVGTGKDLYAVFPVFRDALDDVAAQFIELEYPLLDVMWAEPGSSIASLLNRTDFAQPVLFALEVSLWRLWQSWGVKAAFLLGHSVGEISVAHVSGILNLRDACRLVFMRGRLMQAITRHGKTIAIEASSTEVAAVIKESNLSDKVEVAGYNTPSQTVLSGDFAAVEAIEAHFGGLGVKRKVLNTRHAFHSYHMDEILDEFTAVAQTMQFCPPTIPIISSMTGRLASEGELEQADYWPKQARNAVRFCDAFQCLFNEGANIFLEIGPSQTLCGLGAACLPDVPQAHSALWLPSLKPNTDECSLIQENIGKLYELNVPVDWYAFFGPFGCRRVELPTYAFQREVAQPAKQSSWFDRSLQNTGADKAAQDVRSMMFEINWRPVESHKAQPHGSWGLLCPSEETAWTKDVQKVLLSTDIQLVSVTKLQEAEGLDGLLSLWDSNADVIVSAHDFAGKALSQLQEVIRTGYAAPVVWVTRHAVGVDHNDHPIGIGAAPLLGLMRTARSEHPELRLRLIDVDLVTPLTSLGLALMLEGPTEITVRKGQLLEPHMERSSLAATSSPSSRKLLLRAGGTVLVTGGLGDIGSRVARRLVSSHGVRDLVLLSRRGMQDPGAEAIVASLAKLGAKITVVAIDVAVPKSLRSILQIFTAERPLRGVVHAAGVVDSGTLPCLTAQKFASTFMPKVDGLWNLHQLTKDMDLDFFVMFSSISSVMGLPGLGNYAAANSFVDMVAYLRRAQGLPATSLAYGTWDGDGMITTLVSATRAHLSQFGLGLLAPEVGLDLFEQAVQEGRVLSIPAVLDVERLRVYCENQGGVPPFLRSMLGQSEATKPVLKSANLRDILVEAAPESRSGIVLRMVQATVAQALEYATPDDLDASRPLQEFGIDSLTAVLMRNRLATLTGIALPPNIALFHPNLRALSDYLLSKLTSEINKPKVTATATSYVDMTAVRRGVLDPKIQFHNVTKHTTTCSRHPKSVLVTGPTGFVGAFMVYEFLQRGMNVYCLVRASSHSHAQERMVKTLKRYSLWKPDHEPLIHSVVGDLSQPFLGLCEAKFDDLANVVDYILHSGALVDWMRPLEDYLGPNILGTHEILRLASRGRGKAVHFISTISTLPIHLGYGLTENDREYSYGTSKYIAEGMVSAARFRGALASSYRLPFVAASATTGHFRLDRGDFLNNLITGSLDLGAFPSIGADLSSVLPVDYLCNTIATIMIEDHQRIGEDYDFVNPQSPTFDHFFQVMGAASCGEAILPFSEWHSRALEYAAAHPKSCIARITTIIDGYTDETAAELMKGGPISKHVLGLDVYPPPLLRLEGTIAAAGGRASSLSRCQKRRPAVRLCASAKGISIETPSALPASDILFLRSSLEPLALRVRFNPILFQCRPEIPMYLAREMRMVRTIPMHVLLRGEKARRSEDKLLAASAEMDQHDEVECEKGCLARGGVSCRAAAERTRGRRHEEGSSS